MRVAVLGGGGFRVPLVHRALVRSRLPIAEIVLHDVSATRLGVISSVLDDRRVSTTTDLEAAVTGADIVLSAIRVGGNAARVRDERQALALGLIGQETIGAGGLAYALRCVPEARRIAEVIARRAPAAWVVSMTNPAGVVTETMRPLLGDRVIGVCDSPVGLVRRTAEAVGLDGRAVADLEVDYIGLNHHGWLRSLADPGTADALPALLADPDRLESFEEGRLFGGDLLRSLGTIPNEYLYYFYCAREALAAIVRAGQTRGEQVAATQTSFYAAASGSPDQAGALWQATNRARNASYHAELRSPDEERAEVDVEEGGYEGVAVALLESLTGGSPTRLILNVANGTTIAQLPADAVIETVCEVDAAGARPLATKALTLDQLGLLAAVKSSERDAIDAALTRSRALAVRAFATHPLIGSGPAAIALARSWWESVQP
ncbi:MAG: 6-phospho-beta-glucosidase [Pseudonocardiales bacterium]|nr:6-phospho-beta-glucosidase [Pseudonocardiales bacterium]